MNSTPFTQKAQGINCAIIIAAISSTMTANAFAGDGACDFSVDIDHLPGGGQVTIEWGGIWPTTCVPSQSGFFGGTLQPIVEDNTIKLQVSYGCLDEYCDDEPTPYCLSETLNLVAGEYDVVMAGSGWQCDSFSMPLGSFVVEGVPWSGPVAVDFNDGQLTGWISAWPNPDYEAQVIEGELHSNNDTLVWLNSTMAGGTLYEDGTTRVTVRYLQEPENVSSPYLTFRTLQCGQCCSTIYRLRRWPEDFGVAEIHSIYSHWLDCLEEGTSSYSTLETGVPYRFEVNANVFKSMMTFWAAGDAKPAPQLQLTWAIHVGEIQLNSGHATILDDFVFTPAGWELLDDFIGTGLADWTTVDLTQSQSATFDFEAGRLVLGSTEPAGNMDGAGIAYAASMADPEAYANGTIRTIVRAQDSNADIIARASAELDDWYILALNPIDGELSLSKQIDGLETLLTAAQTGFASGEDWYLEFTFVGDELSARAWPIHGEHLAEPLLSITDTSLTQGGIGIGTDGPSNIKRPVPLNLEVANVWFQAIEPTLTGDLNGDGVVDVLDLLILLEEWGSCPKAGPCPADLNGDGVVNVFDLLILLENWG